MRAHNIDTHTRTDLSVSEVMVALMCCLQREREREGCEGDDYMMRVRKAVHESCGVVGERRWDDAAFDDALKLMMDTGASTHMTNSRGALMHDTVVTCDVQVVGVGGAPISITEKGSVSLVVGGRQLVLRDVLLSEAAHLGAGPVNEPQVLVGVRKFARDTGLGLSFPADGKSMHVYDGDECIATAETNDDALYVIRRQDLVSPPAPSGQGGHEVRSPKNGHIIEAASVYVAFSTPMGEKNTNILGSTARVYPATAQVRARSDSRENASSPPHVSTAQVRTRMKGGVAVNGEKGSARHSARQRMAYGKLIHARMHHGRSSNVLSALKKAYGDRYEEDRDPCDACMYAKARMITRSKTHRRTAKHLGDRLHYDLFHGPSRSEEGYKYVLVVIDEFTSRSWTVGLKRKSGLFLALRGVIAEVETKMRGARVSGLATGGSDRPHVVEIRSDNAKENVLMRMQEMCLRKGTRMETSVPYQQWQNGKAERLGGHIMKGGRALQYGGCVPERDWFKCVSAFNHIRNRTPTQTAQATMGARHMNCGTMSTFRLPHSLTICACWAHSVM